MGTRLPRNTVYTQNLGLCHPRAILIIVMLNIFKIILEWGKDYKSWVVVAESVGD